MAEHPWLAWNHDPFDRAADQDRPVALLLETPWAATGPAFRRDVLQHPDVAAGLRDTFVPVRVDGDRMPHVQDRYIATGWPTLAFLTPTGELLWSAAAPQRAVVTGALRAVTAAWRDRRAEFQTEIERRRRAVDATRLNGPPAGLIRRDAARAVLFAIRSAWDPRNGGFGDPPRFPHTDALELLLDLAAAGDAQALDMAATNLDGIRAGELWDQHHGGFFRYALEPDWTRPRPEKLLDVQAGLLRAFARGAAITGRADWHDTATRTITWVDQALSRPDGLWAGSIRADDGHGSADDVTLTDRAADWIAALADAGHALDDTTLRDNARRALARLVDSALVHDRIHHFQDDDGHAVEGLLVDTVALLRACNAVHHATGDAAARDTARLLARLLEQRFRDRTTGAFRDHDVENPSAGLRDPRTPFAANATAALELVRLARATGDRGPRAVAEHTLAVISRHAPRYGIDAATFVRAVNAFFEHGVRS